MDFLKEITKNLAFLDNENKKVENGEKNQEDSQLQKQLLDQRKFIQQKLDSTTQLLQDLRKAQNERLSANPPPHLALVRPPTALEHELGK